MNRGLKRDEKKGWKTSRTCAVPVVAATFVWLVSSRNVLVKHGRNFRCNNLLDADKIKKCKMSY